MKGMVAFYHLFPEIGTRETRTATIFGRDRSLPDDSYGFIELYCVPRVGSIPTSGTIFQYNIDPSVS
jgi:hypothetical protein